MAKNGFTLLPAANPSRIAPTIQTPSEPKIAEVALMPVCGSVIRRLLKAKQMLLQDIGPCARKISERRKPTDFL